MATSPASGVLLVRAWIEEGRLKARVLRLAGGETETVVAVGADAVLAAVAGWLELLAPPEATR